MISGTVRTIQTKDWNGKILYTIILNNDSTYYGCGNFNPKAKPGDFVQFEANKNEKGFWQVDKNTLDVTANTGKIAYPTPPTAAIAHSNGNGAAYQQVAIPSGLGREDYWRNKETRDVVNDKLRSIGAARNTAIEWVKFLVEKEALPSLAKAKAASREEVLNKILDDYTRLFMKGELEEPVVTESEIGLVPVQVKAQVEEIPWQ